MSDLKDALLEWLVQLLDNFPPEIIVIIISCFPILELRGALPTALFVFNMPVGQAYVYSVIGNMLPVLPILLLFRPLSDYLLRYKWYERLYNWLYSRTMKKSKNVERYGALGLILFTAVPLPVTGAWTACLAASFFNIRIKYAFLAILAGVMLAGIIVGVFSYGIVSFTGS
jgi:uncharacterized membrane protein